MNWSSDWKSRVDGKARIDREKLYGDKLKIRFQRSRSVICQWAPLASNVKQERWACNESWTEFDSKNRLHSIIAEQKAFSLRFFSLVSMKEMKLLVANPFLSTFRFSGSLNQLTLLFSQDNRRLIQPFVASRTLPATQRGGKKNAQQDEKYKAREKFEHRKSRHHCYSLNGEDGKTENCKFIALNFQSAQR